MKYIATRTFRNVPTLNIPPVEDAPHEAEIPEGTVLELTDEKVIKDLLGAQCITPAPTAKEAKPEEKEPTK